MPAKNEKAKIGDGQRRVLIDSIKSLGTMSLSKTIFDACKKHAEFGDYFTCSNPDARIRTLLQRFTPEASQGFRGRAALFSVDQGGEKKELWVWGLREWQLNPSVGKETRLPKISESFITEREGKNPTTYRVGRDEFRQGVIAIAGGRCPFTDLAELKLLDAAHLIPWKDDIERLNPYNGILLSKTLHAGFDNNLFGINPDGELIFDSSVSMNTRLQLGLRRMTMTVDPQQKPFLEQRWKQFQDVLHA
jgi:hypothetical protein